MGKRIMIVDDTAIMRYILKNLFEKNGYEVVAEVANGADAVAHYPIIKPDLITMDITMPDMDGITAVQEILKIDPKAKIVMCSTMGQVYKVKDAIMAGAKGFLVKPLENDLVLKTIKKLLED